MIAPTRAMGKLVPGTWLYARGYAARFWGVSGMETVVPSNRQTRRPFQSQRRSTRASRFRPTRPATAAKNRSGRRFLAWQYAPVLELHGSCPRETRWATRRATAARQDWSAARAWPRKTHRVTTGENTRSSHRPTVASASVIDRKSVV